VVKTGTFSGLDVLNVGKIEPGARVELVDGATATVLAVEGKRLSRHGVTRGSVQIQRNGGSAEPVDPTELISVLDPPARGIESQPGSDGTQPLPAG
jgi:hypothetical protein